MRKLIFTTVAAMLVLGGSALAANESWLVTEENVAGVKGAQGAWSMRVEGSKVSGSAEMMTDKGAPLTYQVDGSVENGVYTLNITDRSDGKKGCVWSGHVPASSSSQKQGLIGYAECDGAKLIIRASMVGH